MPGTEFSPYDAADWTVTVAGVAIPWTQLEFTFEQFHVPGQFHVEAPLQAVDIPLALADKPPEVVVKYKGREFFVGQVDETHVTGGYDEGPEGGEPEDTLSISGRDLAGRLALSKVVEKIPSNRTAHELVKEFCAAVGLTDTSLIGSTSEQIGEFVQKQYGFITQGLNRFDVLHDIAEAVGFVFRVKGRKPFFGVQPDPTSTTVLEYQKNFSRYAWTKSHTNADVKVRVLGWNKKKKRIAAEAGNGSLIIQKVVPGITALSAKALADKLARQAERGLMTMDIPGLPGDPAFDDILHAFDVRGIAKGIDQVFWPSRIHHILTQDDHVMDLSLYNARRILA